MSFVFKQIDSAYKTSTPFYAHKRWVVGAVNIPDLTNDPPDTVGGEISMSIYYGKYTQSYFIGPEYEELTTLNEFTRNIWNSTNHLYLENFQGKPYEKYKQGHIGVETRNVTDVVQVFSIPQKIIGSGIKPGSFRLSDGSYTFFDDGNGNILGYNQAWSAAKIRESVYNTASRDLYYCSFLFNESYKYTKRGSSFSVKSHGNLGATVPWNLDPNKGIAGPTHGPSYLTGQVISARGGSTGMANTLGKFYIDFGYDDTVTGSSYIRIPDTDKLNFNANDDFTIAFWFNGQAMQPMDSTLIAKNGRRRVLRRSYNPNNTNDYTDYISDEVHVAAQYPFLIEYINGNTIKFSVSDGVQTPSVSTVTTNGFVICMKSGSQLIIQAGGGAASTAPCGCLSSTTNDCDIFMGVRGDQILDAIPKINSGNPDASTNQFYGVLGTVHFFNKGLSLTQRNNLNENLYDNHYGSILYDQGQIIWTNTHGLAAPTTAFAKGKSCDFDSMQFRSTKLITTNEFICASGPGELNMTTNPSILVNYTSNCSSTGETMQGPNEGGECLSFVTGSDFSPYVTGVGLYNDQGDLLVFGKLATPIKKATNCDTIFIVKWDES
jgi:hypothetical protein